MNVLLKDVNGRVAAKLTDFGLSKSKISKSSKMKEGTPSYRAPELGEEELSGAVDVFAFGGVLIYLFGEDHVHPFDGLDADVISRKMIRCYDQQKALKVPELETIEVPEIREIASHCLSTQSGSRPTAHDLLDRFSELCGLSGSTEMGSAAEDVTLNILMQEIAQLKAKMKEKDMEVDNLDLQMGFLLERDL